MKKNNYQKLNFGKKRNREGNLEYVYAARKMWASSECLNPYDAQYACESLMLYLKKEATRE